MSMISRSIAFILLLCIAQVLAFIVLPINLTPLPRHIGAHRAAASYVRSTHGANHRRMRPRFVIEGGMETGITGNEFQQAPSAAEAAQIAAANEKSEEEDPRVSFREAPGRAIKQWWKRATKIDRKQLAALGASALCSYGLVSNVNYCGTMCIAYVIHAQKYAKSPFSPGQWKAFLAIYGGLWAAMNFLRPIRLWLALGLTPYFDKLVDRIKDRLGVKRGTAFGITVFLVNICGTLTFLTTGLYLSSLYTKIPLFPPKLPPGHLI